jgi:hypothetical protein
MECNCVMFRNAGTCYHTGYKPIFNPSLEERMLKSIDKAVEQHEKVRKEEINKSFYGG